MKSIDRIITKAQAHIRYIVNQVLIHIHVNQPSQRWTNLGLPDTYHDVHNFVVAAQRPHIKKDDLLRSNFQSRVRTS